jgi:hypothetical protein
VVKLALVLVACTGCAQLLGLDSTKFDFKDAMVDAPSVCDGAPACVANTGRSVCGQLVDTGANGGALLRVASPTGTACSSTEGPCALAVYGQTKTAFFASSATRVAGTIDDCGRFVVPDLDATAADVAVVFTATTNVTTATLVLGRPTMTGTDTGVIGYGVTTATVGTDTGVIGYGVTTATEADWGSQLSTTISAGYLVTQVDTTGAPAVGFVDWVMGGPVVGPPVPPWDAYFSGGKAFGAFDPQQRMTDASGTSLVVPPTGSFMLGGARTGRTCKQIGLQLVPNALVHVALSC